MSKALGEGEAFLRRQGRFTLHIHRNGRVDFVPGKPTPEAIEAARVKLAEEMRAALGPKVAVQAPLSPGTHRAQKVKTG
jgi:hypothetical protein